MSKARFIYRRMGRKKSSSTAQSHGKQAAQPFFDFGGDRSFFSGKSPEASVNRKCDNCEQEEKKGSKKEDGVAGKQAPPDVSSKIKSLQGGSPLPSATRAFFESKFKVDLSGVKIHTGAEAQDLAASVSAKAFTYKDNVVFNSGEYNPESESGKKLLAHELTHVIQQGGGVAKMEQERKDNEAIQRAPKTSDFKIKGLDPATASDNSKIRFHMGESLVPSEEVHKIESNAKPPERVLTLTGFSSEEGADKDNQALAARRANNVEALLKKKGHKGDKDDIVANNTAGDGIMEYRKMRTVEIVDTPKAGGPVPSSVPSSGVVTVSCGTDIPQSFGKAAMTTIVAIAKLINPGPAEKAIFATFFGKNKIEAVRTNLFRILSEIVRHSSAFNVTADCHAASADADCVGAGAYCDTNVSPARMVFCEEFVGYDLAKKAEYIVHEAAHGTPGLMADDKGYEGERIIRTLSDADKFVNADNYLLLVRLLNDPSATGFSSPDDTVEGTTDPKEKDFARKVLAYLEQWTSKAGFSTAALYGQMQNAVTTPADWTDAGQNFYYIKTMKKLHPLFGVTDPGGSKPLALPTKDDKVGVAGIHDRYANMSGAMGGGVTVAKNAKGIEQWAKNYGSKAEVQPSFFSKSETEAIRHLVRLMAKSSGDIPSSLIESYVDAADKMRVDDGVGP